MALVAVATARLEMGKGAGGEVKKLSKIISKSPPVIPILAKKEMFRGKTEFLTLASDIIIILLMLIRLLQAKK